MHSELANRSIGGLIVVDLGVRAGELRKGTPTVVLDHHVPQGAPTGASLVTGFGMNPIPTSSLLAFWCASALTNVEDLVWLAAIGVIGDMAEKHEFAEMKRAKSRYGVTVLREAAVLVNQPRRSSSGEAAPALALLLKASTPGEITSGEHPETAQLIAARNEVKSELERVRKTAPRISGRVVLIRFASACQIHPLVAQMWSRRMRGRIVMVANTGFRPGWVHFAARSAEDIDLVEFLREHAPSGADASYGGGHRNASGGALRAAQWNEFIRKLGFERDMEVS